MLASENFDKMADIIAEKAAEKINSHLIPKTETKKYYQENKDVDRRKHINVLESNMNVDVINDDVSTKIPKVSKLSLKYKLFTKKHIKLENQNVNPKSSESLSDNEVQYSVGNLSGTKNNSSSQIELNQVIDHDEVNGKSVKNQKNADNSETQETIEHDKDVNNKDKVNKYGNLNAESNLKNNTVQANHVYEEGGRIFALQSSSDYEEYHKELNRTINEETSAGI